jgi:iron complex transport system permease protein
LLLLADLAGRMLFQPLDIPAGVFTAGIGAPFFMYLLFRKKG